MTMNDERVEEINECLGFDIEDFSDFIGVDLDHEVYQNLVVKYDRKCGVYESREANLESLKDFAAAHKNL